MSERVCKNCAFVQMDPISFDGGKTIHSINASCNWARTNKISKAPYWVKGWHTVHPDAPRTKKGCPAFKPPTPNLGVAEGGE